MALSIRLEVLQTSIQWLSHESIDAKEANMPTTSQEEAFRTNS